MAVILSIGESIPKHWKPGSALIKLVEGTDHTHSFISWKDTSLGIRKVGEAKGGGGRMVINSQFKQENKVIRVFQYTISEEMLKSLEIWMWNNLKPYGYKHLIGLGIMRLERLWKTDAVNRMKDGDFSQVCVEMTAKAIELATGIDFPGDVEDYGLQEMHSINMLNANAGICLLADSDTIARINGG